MGDPRAPISPQSVRSRLRAGLCRVRGRVMALSSVPFDPDRPEVWAKGRLWGNEAAFCEWVGQNRQARPLCDGSDGWAVFAFWWRGRVRRREVKA